MLGRPGRPGRLRRLGPPGGDRGRHRDPPGRPAGAAGGLGLARPDRRRGVVVQDLGHPADPGPDRGGDAPGGAGGHQPDRDARRRAQGHRAARRPGRRPGEDPRLGGGAGRGGAGRGVMSRFDGKTALVVGGAQGMGLACAERFGAEGANLALFDIEEGTLETAAAALRARGYAVETASARTAGRFGAIDVLVHTAAVVELKPLLEFPENMWRRIVDVNLTGVFLTVKAAGQVMAERGGGAIVVFASTNAFFAEESNVPYSATKGGIVMFVRNAAMDLARHRIRINAVDPGIIDTRLSRALVHDPVAGPDYLKRIPAGRYGTPDDIAKVVLFLASDDAGYMTGEDVIIDGGLTLGATLGIEDLGLQDTGDSG